MTRLATATAAPAAPVSRARRWAALAVLSASLLVITMDMTILNIALPEMAAELRPSSDQQLWIIDIYSLVLAGLLVPWAGVADRWGRKRMLLLGYSIFGLVSLLVLFADSAAAVIAIRAVLGVGGAMIMPTTLSLIRVTFTDPRERASALSIWAAVSGLGAAAGPLVGGVLLEHFSWHAAFLVNVPLMLAGVVAGALILPESRVRTPGRWDVLAAGLSLVGMVALVWSIKEFGKEASLAVSAAWVAAVVAVVALSWFVARCLRREHPLLEFRLFRSRIFSAGIIAAFGSMFGMMAMLLLLAQWLQLVNGASPIAAGVQLIPVALGASVASVAAPPLARVVGARAVLAGGLLLAAVGMFVIGLQTGGLALGEVLIALALVGAGTGSLAIGSAMIMMGSPEDKAGNAGALEESSYELGAALGVAVLGSVSALVYRAALSDNAALGGLPTELTEAAGQSLGAADAIAGEFGIPVLADAAGSAFVESMELTGIIGGVLMLIVAALVFWMTPRGTDISAASH